MKVTFHDLGRRVKDVLLALDRNASVTILYQGTENAVLSPVRQRTNKSVTDHRAFGMWRDREDVADVDAYVRNLRTGRLDRSLNTG